MTGYDDYSEILISVSYDIYGNPEHYDFDWRGKSPKVMISTRLLGDAVSGSVKLEDDGKVVFGPYRLRLIEKQPWQGRNEYIREDYPFWRLAIWWHKAGRMLDIAYRRLIITLSVWRLADYHEASIPSWHDVHLIQKVKQWLKK